MAASGNVLEIVCKTFLVERGKKGMRRRARGARAGGLELKKRRVPKVDLLDPTVEPTDAEFGALMREMLREVRKKDARTRRAARAKLKAAVRDAAHDAGRKKSD